MCILNEKGVIMVYNEFLVRPEPRRFSKIATIEIYPDDDKSSTIETFDNNKFRDLFEKEFQTKEKESYVWDQAVLSLLHKPNKLVSLLKSNRVNLYLLDNNIYYLVNYFGTTDVEDKVKLAQLSNIKNNPAIESVSIDGSRIVIKKADGDVIDSLILSKTFNWLKHDEVLESSMRMGKSHEMSVQIARCLSFPCKVVTGKICGITSKSKYLHSWVETTIDGEEKVIDYSMNSIMNKKGYYSLLHATSISKINQEDLESDLEFITPLVKAEKLTPVEYLVYRDQIMETISTSTHV